MQGSVNKEPLTICCVFYSAASRRYIEMNREFTRHLNLQDSPLWLVGDNAPDDFARDGTWGEGMRVIRNVSMEAFVKDFPAELFPMRASYHHASALNALVPHISTRYALILDGDYFLVRAGWIRTVLNHMHERGLVAFGSPWHPRWWKKVRYFPAVHSLFLDLKKIPQSKLDFRPQYHVERVEDRAQDFLPRWLRNRIEARGRIGSSRDTAYRLYELYARDVGAYECVQPVFTAYEESAAPYRMLRVAAESCIPEPYSYLPRRSSYTNVGFAERGYFDARGHGWEEFVWQGKPFGFHLRSLPRAAVRNRAEEEKVLRTALASFSEHPAK